MELLHGLFRFDFLPHGHCFFWQPEVLWLNVGSDLLIALAYYSIPLALVAFVRRRPGVTFGFLFWMFGAFIFLCGTTHLVEIWTVWSGVYYLQGLVKFVTAGVSLATAGVLWTVIPQALLLPMPAEIEATNLELQKEIARRELVEAELRRVQSELEERIRERTAALEQANLALKREVAERERAEELFRRAVDSSANGMLVTDAKGALVLVSTAVERIFGYEPGELVGAPIETLVPQRFRAQHPSHRALFLREPAIRQMGAGRDLFGLRKDGSEVPVEIGLSPIRTDEGTLVLSVVIDITERKRSERLIEEKARELETSNRELDEFAHVVSHDLKAPLRGITSLATWITDDCAALLPNESREHLGQLVERSRRMSDLIDGVLQYSRLGRIKRELSAVDAHRIAEEVIDSLEPPAGIRVRIAGRLPVVVYDRTQLVQVMQNLVENAIQHLGKPTGEIVVSCHEEPDRFELAVHDDGVGIDTRHFERIFKIFQILGRPFEEGSTGVGLAIVKRIVENHGGSIAIESVVGSGTTFRFTVPKAGAQSTREPVSRNG
jgi:PAS domain S-box-containing protein